MYAVNAYMAADQGFLTILSSDGREIYGEFADATLEEEETEGGINYIFSAVAGDGTIDQFRRLDADGIENVTFRFEREGKSHSGAATLLRPETHHNPVRHIIRLETPVLNSV